MYYISAVFTLRNRSDTIIKVVVRVSKSSLAMIIKFSGSITNEASYPHLTIFISHITIMKRSLYLRYTIQFDFAPIIKQDIGKTNWSWV